MRGRRVAIVTHRNADLDAVGSALLLADALSGVASEVCVSIPEGPNKQSKRALEKLRLSYPECSLVYDYDVVIAVDAANLVQLAEYATLYARAPSRIAVDHHLEGSVHESATVRLVVPEASSTVEVVVLMLDEEGLTPKDARVATLALAGLVSDSRRFIIAGPLTFRAALRLTEWGGDYKEALELAQPPRDDQGQGEDVSLRLARLKAFSRLRVGRSCHDILVAVTHIGSFESVVARSLVESGADVAVVVTERRDYFRVSVRVSRRSLDLGIMAAQLASYLAGKFGGEGGGHEATAMAQLDRRAASTAEELADMIAKSLPGKVSRLCVESRRSAVGGKSGGSSSETANLC